MPPNSFLTTCLRRSGLWLSLPMVFSGLLPQPVHAQQSPADRPRPVIPNPLPRDNLPPSQQPQPEPQPQPQPSPSLNDNLPPPAQTPPEIPNGVKVFRVDRYQIENSRVFSQTQIDAVTQPFRGREISFAELLQAAEAITQLYVKNHYITTGALIPANRDIKNGIVPVRVQEGFVKPNDIRVQFVVPVQKQEGGITRIQYEPAKKPRLQANYIRKRLALATQAPLNRQRLIEAIQLLKLNPLIQDVRADLSEGAEPGQSILTVDVVEAKTLSASVLLDNGRSPSVGTFRRQLQLSQANLLGWGDGLLLTYANTNGSNEGSFSYTVPVNPRNGTISFNFGISSSNVIEKPFDILDIHSNSSYFELSFRQPIIQSPTQEFALGLTATRQTSKAKLIDGEIPFPVPGSDFEGRTRVNALRFFQDWILRRNESVFALRSQFSVGLDIFDATINERAPDGRFFAWRGQTQWVKLLAPNTLLLLRGDLQLADRALVPQEQFGLGGQLSVRGYRQDLLLSDSGLFASAEVRIPIWRLPQIDGLLQIAPFIDIGTAWNLSGFADPDPRTLAAIGLGLRFQIADRLDARFDWGIPLVAIDQDRNTLQEKGLYFSLIYRFF
ncbi:ShlB/FhaC/HecB family hemolysin secretion/activation protein [Kovacikia minuta CCNUW1]|uniref:ShlB/FhaC/HecB family hemolysin secretion/activation protein n=1 Tax=Kovacikia minuta TaxID=2931930 RepID=UPI001CCE4EE3|nr:ShlB/FhaC/HecB family hemolysin secretion/activation protein [Kovacikia minuta]UBF29702.1 ShlB/FhaC/HecB family hemolysin secretion/activation protein [Kovacikia minuta CCNUW1]